jgi:hypothetical protein
MPPEFLPYLQEFGLPGLGLALLAWVTKKAIPHIANAIVQDRKNRRSHALAMRKLDEQRLERERRKLPL